MMKNERRYSVRGIATAIVLAVAGVWLAILCLRMAVIRVLPPETPVVARLAPDDPDIVLRQAAQALLERRGIVDSAMLAAVRRAALAAPLDARPFLILGHQQLLDDQPKRALATLEAGQRLDPRERVIHLLLLDRYLRTGQFAKAATQFAISARLVGSAGTPIATAMAQMSLSPETRAAVRQTLRSDPVLERSVLIALSASDTAPAAIFALASPDAHRTAGDTGSWGPVLIARLVQRDRYRDARSVWQHVYRLSDAQIVSPIFDPTFAGLPGSPPFGWTLASGTVGAAAMQNGSIAIDYYGRDSGELASQLLILRPGVYRFGITVEGSKTGVGPSLAWTLQCAAGGKPVLMTAPIAGTGTRHLVTASFLVPADCPAQRLVLAGEAGEFPNPIGVTLHDLTLRTAPGSTP